MKVIACMALKPGMVLGEDVFNIKGELLVSANTTLDDTHLKKLSRHSIMCVTIKEAVDFATSHYEKIRLSSNFQTFETVYKENLMKYKAYMISFVTNNMPFHISQLMDIYRSTISCAPNSEVLLDYLYNMLPSEDDMTHAHCFNSALIAGVFAKWLNMSPEDTDTLIKCGFLYDIGKLKLPNSLIWKPGKLTDLEFTQIKTHTLIGFDLLKNLDLDTHIINATLMHHERCDGSGYPSKLRVDKIDRFAKYTAIIDSYEAMASARIYRQSLHPFQVIANFEKTGFLVYDEAILRPILARIAVSKVGFKVRLSNNNTGEIVMINQHALSRPIVRSIAGLIDLSTIPDISISAIY